MSPTNRRGTDGRFFELALRAARNRRSPRVIRRSEAMRQVTYRLRAERALEPPADLHRLSTALGVAEVRIVPLAMRGRCVLEGRAIAIEINERLDRFEQRFTHAHELAHLIVEQGRVVACTMGQPGLSSSSAAAQFEIEEICDAGAEEILLSGEWLAKRVGARPPTLEAALTVAAESETSIEFAAKRAIDSALWDAKLFVFGRRGDAFLAVNTYPASDPVFLSEIHPLSITDVREHEVRSVEIVVGDAADRYSAEITADGPDRLLALVAFGRPG